MKKLLLCVLGIVFCATVVLAQEKYPVFSSALFLGSGTYQKGDVVTKTGKKDNVVTKTVVRRSVIRYEEGQTELTENQKNALLKIVDRFKAGQTKSIRMQAFSDVRWHSHVRLNILNKFLEAYIGVHTDSSIAAPGMETAETNNSVYITEGL